MPARAPHVTEKGYITFPSNLSIRLYSEVDISRWRVGKVFFARDSKIVSGDKNGTFKPTQPATRAELMGVLRRAAEFRLSAGRQPNLVAKEPSKTFSNTQNYGAASIITQRSSYCSIAAAINEIGNRFAPNDSAKPHYAAAATLRMLKCVNAQSLKVAGAGFVHKLSA